MADENFSPETHRFAGPRYFFYPFVFLNWLWLDALLSAVQMPPGIPVACVAIDGAKNAGLLAARIINA